MKHLLFVCWYVEPFQSYALPIRLRQWNFWVFPAIYFGVGENFLKVSFQPWPHTKLVCKFCGNPLMDGMPSVLWRCWLGGRKGTLHYKNWVVGCWCGYLGWGADLHVAQQMPLPLTISCSSKSRLVLPSWFLPFWYLLTWVVSDKFQKSSEMTVCVCNGLLRSTV